MKSKTQRSREPKRPTAVPPAGSRLVSGAGPSPRRKWLYRGLAAVVLPLLVMGGLELALRLLGFGFDPHFFRRLKIGGQNCLVANDAFGLRFFPRRLARTPSPVVMAATKEPDAFRVFIFGESAAMGEPRPNYGAARYLEVLLAERYPRSKFEIVNTSVTAINSHAIRSIAQECAGRAGDLWIVYMGNNEMVGPFGAATVFGVSAPPLWLPRVQLQARRLRTGQMIAELSQRLHEEPAGSSSWHGMEMFLEKQVLPDDPRRERVHGNFDRNLEDIVHTGLASGARVILSTVAVNLKDCPPFVAAARADLSADDRAAYKKLCHDGAAAAAQGRLAEAQSCYQRATEIDPQAAEAQFQLAGCHLRQTNVASARSSFLKAVDLDALPFRADSRINDSIRTAARRFACESLALCDAAELLNAASPDGIAGEEMFYEHVHLNSNGNYALALAWAGQVEKFLGPKLRDGARPAWASQAECEELLGLTDWNRVSILDEILRRVERPPFIGQSGNADRVARVRGEIDRLRQNLTTERAAQARAVYARALGRAPEDFRLRENYAEFLEALREFRAAIPERRKVQESIPQSYFAYYCLGADLKAAGDLEQAQAVMRKAAALKPDNGEVRLELGIIAARRGEWEQARQELELARQFSPYDPLAPLYLGEVLWKLERRSEAMASLREAIRLAPSDWQPHYRLASNLAQSGHLPEAAAEYQEALRLNPANVKMKTSLAAVLLSLGRKPEALRQLDEALQLEPGNPAVLELLGKVPDK